MLEIRNLFIFLSLCALPIEPAKILAIFPVPSSSHYIYGSAILKELASRGHEITSVGIFPQKEPIKNFRDILIKENMLFLGSGVNLVEKSVKQSKWDEWKDYVILSQYICLNIFENKEFQELLQKPQGKFDLIIVEVGFGDSLSGLGEHFKAPMISLSPFGTTLFLDDVVGNTSPASMIPSIFSTYTSQMSLWERIHNFLFLSRIYIQTNMINYSKQKALYEKYFPNAKLTFDEAKKQYSLLLLNQHHSLSYPRPYVPNVIEAGGAHIPHKPGPLPTNIQQFLDNATDGVIYFSMGSTVNSKDIDIKRLEVFLNVFRGLKQKVLWKFEDTELPGKPDNVFIIPWVPQHSVLAHPNVKLFITHGGLLSTTEAIFYGKTFLGIPMIVDQPRNIALSVNRGIALSVDFKTLNEPELKYKLNELLYNPKYTEKMKEVSFQYHDKPMTAMETAIYWIEYVLRHKGANHLRNAGSDLNLWQYYSVDVIAIILFGLVLAASLTILFAKYIIRKIFGTSNTKKTKRN